MSDTPRTDAEVGLYPPADWQIVHANFARMLERELNHWQLVAQSNWETVEDVCIGTRLECPKCGKPRPCCCQDLE